MKADLFKPSINQSTESSRLEAVELELSRVCGLLIDDAPELAEAVLRSVDGGKRVRPRLVLDAYAALGGTNIDDAVRLAAAMELWHAALTIHDDLLDDDDYRRGKANAIGIGRKRLAVSADKGSLNHPASELLGTSYGLLTGDLLLAGAMLQIADLDAARDTRQKITALLRRAMSRTAQGELSDITFGVEMAKGSETYAALTTGAANGPDLSNQQAVIDVARNKTAAYSFVSPLLSAAILAGATEETTALLGEVGEFLGEAYQVHDDVLGVFGQESTLGKSTLGDLREGKRTLLIVFAEEHPEWASVAHLHGLSTLTTTQAQVIRAVIEATGSRKKAQEHAKSAAKSAVELAVSSGLPPALLAIIDGLAASACEREK